MSLDIGMIILRFRREIQTTQDPALPWYQWRIQWTSGNRHLGSDFHVKRFRPDLSFLNFSV